MKNSDSATGPSGRAFLLVGRIPFEVGRISGKVGRIWTRVGRIQIEVGRISKITQNKSRLPRAEACFFVFISLQRTPGSGRNPPG